MRRLALVSALACVAALSGCHADDEFEQFPDGGPAADALPPDGAPLCTEGATETCTTAAGCAGERVCAGGTYGDCEPPPERCDGADDDCDGTVDEGYAVGDACTVGQGTCEAAGVFVCAAAGDDVACDATPGEAGVETCDGLDQDCDGTVDEAIEATPCATELLGVCAAGTTACVDGALACRADVEAGAESCDGLDNDCDGATDEEIAPASCVTDQPGVCAAGTSTCVDGAPGCVADAAPDVELCDGLDNDCDGATDEEIASAPCVTDQPGVCAAGMTTCVDGAPGCMADLAPAPEDCDGLDDDCDGAIDEADDGAPLTRGCYDGPDGTEDVGPCRGGTQTCVDGAYAACADQVLPAAETCNEVDDDCDGALDELDVGACICRPGSEALCYTGPAGTEGVGPCRGGTQTCAPDGTAYGPCVGEVLPAVETCNEVDDDCDGALDDLDIGACICRPGSAAPCYTGPAGTEGVGACRGGTQTCAPDGTAYGPCIDEVVPAAELCEEDAAVDLDCDGATGCDDPSCAAARPCLSEDCANGVDDDDDGYADCTDADCAALIECQRPDVLVCGASSLNVASLFRPEDGVVVAGGCVGGPTVRAIYVTRIGAVDAGWAAYVADGGRIITEYSSSAGAFTAVFGEAAAPGAQRGRCYDNVNPVLRYTPDDPFWQVNVNVPLSPADQSGCGLDLAGFPGITRLGGVVDNQVSLAYRDLGLGRLWLVETDWQDGENLPGRATPGSRALLRAMALDPFDPSCDAADACTNGRDCIDDICVRPAP